MTLMCEECFEQYNIKRRIGLYCKICGGYLVEIDENFIESIVLLNMKGYYTNYCCSGHPNPKLVPNAYIQFEDNIILPYLPKDFLYDKGYKNTIRISFPENEEMIKLQYNILQSAINILEWAESLPYIEGIL